MTGWTETKTRPVVRERSNGVCEKCDRARATEMHHRKNRSQGGLWHPANIVHLCSLCHVEVTCQPAEARECGFAVFSHQNPAAEPLLYRGVLTLLDNDGGYRVVEGSDPFEESA